MQKLSKPEQSRRWDVRKTRAHEWVAAALTTTCITEQSPLRPWVNMYSWYELDDIGWIYWSRRQQHWLSSWPPILDADTAAAVTLHKNDAARLLHNRPHSDVLHSSRTTLHLFLHGSPTWCYVVRTTQLCTKICFPHKNPTHQRPKSGNCQASIGSYQAG